MFYAHIVLAKKGPLARIWLAAHWDKKLTKAHVVETNIEKSVDGILEPKVKLALRTSGHLLLGVVRIYSRKAKYLLADCNEAFVKIKMAFRSGVVDLPEGHREANVNAITLPEVFHDFDTALPELNDVDIEAQFTVNQSRADEITMREDYGALSLSLHDDGFGDMAGFDNDNNVDMHRLDSTIDHNLFDDDDIGGDLGVGIDSTREPLPGTSKDMLGDSLGDPHMDEDGFGDDFGQAAAGLFEGDIFGETTLAPPTEEPVIPPENAYGSDDDDDDHFDTGAPSPMASSIGSRPPSVLGQEENPNIQLNQSASPAMMEVDSSHAHNINEPEKELGQEPVHEEVPAALSTEEESFALATLPKGITKHKRKRKLIVDEVKNISGEEMKSQLANTADIVTTLDLAPPTKRLMYWKETGGVEKLFSLPSRFLPVKGLFSSYQRNLNSRASVLEDFSSFGPPELLALGEIQTESHDSPNKRGRKRKLPLPVQDQQLNPEQASFQADQSHLQPQQLQFDQISFGDNVVRDVPLQDQSSIMNLPVSINATEDTLHQQIMQEDLMQSNVIVNETLMPPPPLMTEDTPIQHVQTPGHDQTFMPQTSANFDDILRCDNTNLGGFTPMTPSGLPNIPMTPGALNLQDEFLSGGQNSGIMAQLNDDDYHQDLDHHDNHDQVNTSAENEFNDFDEYPVPEAQPGDEQQENETDEQFEERVLNKRAQQMFTSIKSKIHDRDTLWLSEMTAKNNKKQAAQKFYALLVLKKFRAIEIQQAEAYADISVRRGDLFDDPKL